MYEDRKEKFKNVPLSTDYEEADSLVKKFRKFQQNQAKEIDEDAMNIFWEWIREHYVETENAAKLLPKSVSDLGHVSEMGTGKYNAPKDFTRSIDWLNEHGICVSNIKAGISPIPHAGRGAFSKKSFPKGDLVTSSPLLHECETSYIHFNIYEDQPNESERTQLLFNYCFAHPNSTIMLCPYSPYVNLINHSQEPNVAIRWSTSNNNNNDWLSLPYDELCAKQHVELVIDFVALRDIQEGDEILLDYGELWQNAWDDHVENFVPNLRNENYLDYQSPAKWNEDPNSEIATLYEQESNPYPSNLITECLFRDDGVEYIPPEGEVDDYQDSPKRAYTGHDTGLHQVYRCNIYERYHRGDEENIIYLVGLRLWEDEEEQEYETMVFDMPRSAIRFGDERYTADYHLENVFRHAIGFPDDIFPQSWR